jgi:hypothetical protein
MWRRALRPSRQSEARRNPPHCQTLLIPANHRILIVPSNPQPLVIPTKRAAPRRNLLSFQKKKLPQSTLPPHSADTAFLPDTAFAKSAQFAISQPRSGARIQPTAQAVGSCQHVAPAPKGRKKRPGIKGVTIRKLPPTHQNHPQSSPIHAPTSLNIHSRLHPLTTLIPKNKGGRQAAA